MENALTFLKTPSVGTSPSSSLYERFQSLPKQVEQNEGQREVGKTHENEVEPRRSKRMRIAKNYGPDFYMYFVEGTKTAIHNSILIVLNKESDPRTYEEAMKSQDSSFWKEVINEEFDSIMENGTWKLVDLPPVSKPVGCKWIFKKKLRVDRSIENLKARISYARLWGEYRVCKRYSLVCFVVS
ncbi:hypothetical protein RJ639_004717 [Escallonia herrerae]|uniref:Reverse transcriptase n=1 Tax=Escallonia herrerae TaxID=1293975 RepID=A0AA89AYA6_9ASTE|nr:hypothetical protein RJ639_004717 [Escallonia herrerae]